MISNNSTKKIKTSVLITLNACIAVFSQNQKPNVILIYADDLGYGEIGVNGQEKILTPHIDQLAKDGINFTQFYTSSPVSAAARCGLLTGKHTGHAHIRGNYEMGDFPDHLEGGQMPLPEGSFTLGNLFKQAGYNTAAIGKWGLGIINSSGNPNKHGFDLFFGYTDQKQAHNYYPSHLWRNSEKYTLNEGVYFSPHQQLDEKPSNDSFYDQFKGKDYAPDLMTEEALSFINDNRYSPFFLYLPYTLPHVSLQAPDSLVRMYVELLGEEEPYLGDNKYLPNRYPKATYAAMITMLDSYVGIIRSKLNELNLAENTLIIFTSDNGPTNNMGGADIQYFKSTAGLRGHKRQLYEGGIRMPLIACWTGTINEGNESNVIGVQYDLMATFADLLDVSPPSTDGVSLLSAILGKEEMKLPRKYLYFEFPENGAQIAIRYNNWKGVRYGIKKDPNVKWELYNLDTDEKEENDLASFHPVLIQEFDEIVKKEHWQPTLLEWEFIDPKVEVLQ